MGECSLLEIKQIFTTYENPKGNADTERFFRTIKEELLWINEFETPMEAKRRIEEWIDWFNREYIHSTLGYLSPNDFEIKWRSHLKAA